jgi:putative SOS response-associated peptidase YedK
MCGRFVSQLTPDALAAMFHTVNPMPNLAPNWNVAPTDGVMIVRCHPHTGERHLDVLHWGLVPHFVKDLKTARKPINARAETLPGSGMFRSAFAQRRCLVPADAFYEWKTLPSGKQPYAIGRNDGQPVVFAGLWEGWRGPEGQVLRTFALITCAANATMRALHERMPVILQAEDWATWLGETPGDVGALLRPVDDAVLRLWPVGREVNSVRNNGAGLLASAPPG